MIKKNSHTHGNLAQILATNYMMKQTKKDGVCISSSMSCMFTMTTMIFMQFCCLIRAQDSTVRPNWSPLHGCVC